MSKKTKSAAAKKRQVETPLSRHLMKVIAATIILIVFVFLAGLLVMFLLPAHEPATKPAVVSKGVGANGIIFEIYPKEKKPPRPLPKIKATTPSTQQGGLQPRIAIIIDDLGYDREIANRFMALDPSLTLSILPESPFNKEIALAAHKAGNEIMLHLPMEPVEYPAINPGPGVLLSNMSPDSLLRQLEKNIADIPYIKGVNNHMGSKLTAESTQLYQIFSVLKKQELFFIDSRTTENTLCGPSANKLQVPFAKRDVFLDNTLSEANIKSQINLLINIAGHKGQAIGIAHPHAETFKILKQHLPSIKKQVQLVPASKLINNTN